MTELQKRVLISVVLIPIAVGIMYLGGFWFFVASAIISSIIIYELLSLCNKIEFKPRILLAIFFNLIILTTFYSIARTNFGLAFLFIFIEIVLFSILLLILELRRAGEAPLINYSISVASIVYITFSFCSLLGLRYIDKILEQMRFSNNRFYLSVNIAGEGLEIGFFLVLMVFVSVWICDSFAYFIGIKFGKHKILPRVSPKKSWEGGIAGLISAVIFVALAMSFTNLNLVDAIVLGLIVGLFGQIGDFAESMFKREVGVKDSSNIIPGHGGLLDRFDSLLFVLPLTFIYIIIVVICINGGVL